MTQAPDTDAETARPLRMKPGGRAVASARLAGAFGIAVAGAAGVVWTTWTVSKEAWASPWFLAAVCALATGLICIAWLWPGIHRSQRSMELAMAGSHDGMFEWDPLTKRLRVGQRLLDMLGYAEGRFPTSHHWLEITHPDDRPVFNAALTAHLKGHADHFYCEYRVQSQSGQWVWLAARGLVEKSDHGPARLMAGSVSDISDRKQREQRMQWLARTDALTHLPNRHNLLERFPAVLSQARRKEQMVGLLFIDVDRFKNVNDTLGHAAGDDVLRELTRRLPQALRDYDLPARQGGDEFIVLLPGLVTHLEAEQVAQRVLHILSSPLEVAGQRLELGASIGIAVYPQDGLDPDSLLRHADLAMYEAKSRGGNRFHAYTPELEVRMAERVSMEHRLRHALEHREVTLHYQPQFDASTGELVGAEALARWLVDGQWVPPDVFIRLAEDTGLVEVLGEQLLQRALEQMSRWEPQLPVGFRLALNLSAREFRTQGLDDRWLEAARHAGVRPDRLSLEVTETVLLSNDTHALDVLQKLRAAGVEIALDDFGTGYASLSYLRVLDLDVLKIDKSFISSVGQDSRASTQHRDRAVVQATLSMAHALGCCVVAEGVETEAQADWLRLQGCDVLQGYGLGRPVNASEFEANYLIK